MVLPACAPLSKFLPSAPRGHAPTGEGVMTKLPPERILETRLCSRLSRIFHVSHPHAGGSKCLYHGRHPGNLSRALLRAIFQKTHLDSTAEEPQTLRRTQRLCVLKPLQVEEGKGLAALSRPPGCALPLALITGRQAFPRISGARGEALWDSIYLCSEPKLDMKMSWVAFSS